MACQDLPASPIVTLALDAPCFFGGPWKDRDPDLDGLPEPVLGLDPWIKPTAVRFSYFAFVGQCCFTRRKGQGLVAGQETERAVMDGLWRVGCHPHPSPPPSKGEGEVIETAEKISSPLLRGEVGRGVSYTPDGSLFPRC